MTELGSFCVIRMLVFLPQQVMKDKWMNAGYEGDELKPHVEPAEDYSDPNRIGETSRKLVKVFYYVQSFATVIILLLCSNYP